MDQNKLIPVSNSEVLSILSGHCGKNEHCDKTVLSFKKYLESNHGPKLKMSMDQVRDLKINQQLVSDIRQLTMFMNTGLDACIDKKDSGKIF